MVARAPSPRHLQSRHCPVRVPAPSAGKAPAPTANPLTVGVVSLATETLRLLGIGKQEYEQLVLEGGEAAEVAPGDVQGLMARLREDLQRGYIITGVIDGSIYAEDCLFVDPTVSFRGLDKWKRNLQLLVPFLRRPSFQLIDLSDEGTNAEGLHVLRAQWRLSTHLSLPWQPLIDIVGQTSFTLNGDGNKIQQHVETWNVTGTQALLQLFTASSGPNSSS